MTHLSQFILTADVIYVKVSDIQSLVSLMYIITYANFQNHYNSCIAVIEHIPYP